jgi:hypothetical protein
LPIWPSDESPEVATTKISTPHTSVLWAAYGLTEVFEGKDLGPKAVAALILMASRTTFNREFPFQGPERHQLILLPARSQAQFLSPEAK